MLSVQNWGLVSYNEALERQLKEVEKVQNNKKNESIIICSHPPVVTLGRASVPADVMGWDGEVVEISRGGRATYHGPNQIIIYPILNLTKSRSLFTARDVHAYLRGLEQSIVATLNFFEVPAEAIGKHAVDANGVKVSYTGVWSGGKKVASIGIAVKKWVTLHGAAINFSNDAQAFSGISPCGFSQGDMTSVEALSSEVLIKKVFEDKLIENLIKQLS